jgi:hypothetical protein
MKNGRVGTFYFSRPSVRSQAGAGAQRGRPQGRSAASSPNVDGMVLVPVKDAPAVIAAVEHVVADATNRRSRRARHAPSVDEP